MCVARDGVQGGDDRYRSDQRKPQDCGREQNARKWERLLQEERTDFASTEKSRFLFCGLGQKQPSAFPAWSEYTVDLLI